jgi:hypothetical protein
VNKFRNTLEMLDDLSARTRRAEKEVERLYELLRMEETGPYSLLLLGGQNN